MTICIVYGFGRMGKIHSSALVKMPHVSRVIIIDSDSQRIKEALQLSRKVSVYGSLKDCLEHEPVISYITISTPSKMHFHHIEQCMELELNILVEKPFVTDMQSASKLLESCSEYKSLIGVGLIERYNPSIQKARNIIASGIIGKPLEIHTRRWGLMPQNPDIGVTLDLASHDVDICRFLIDHQYQEVFARMAGLAQNLETTTIVSGISEGGILISNSVSWRSTSKLREIVVVGETGSLKINTAISEVTLYQLSKPIIGYEGLQYIYGEKSLVASTIDHAKIEPIISEHLAFQSTLLNRDADEIVTIPDAFETLRVIDAIQKSSNFNLPVKL
jgi:UDP-N-acetylglucosamine 3-dehydrogenase